jgi:transposase-like protein
LVEYSESFKEKAVQKMLPPNGRSAGALAAELGLPQPTLSRWLREARTIGDVKTPSKKWTVVEKLRVLVEAGRLEESELGAFLRREGLHEAQLKQWRAEAESALGGATKRSGKSSAQSKRIKQLERELRRKDKALAEAAAILVLKKKAAAIWGDEDDDTTDGSES